MAYFLRSWVAAQARRSFQIVITFLQSILFCFNLKGRMKDGVAWIILGVLALMVMYSAYSCSGE